MRATLGQTFLVILSLCSSAFPQKDNGRPGGPVHQPQITTRPLGTQPRPFTPIFTQTRPMPAPPRPNPPPFTQTRPLPTQPRPNPPPPPPLTRPQPTQPKPNPPPFTFTRPQPTQPRPNPPPVTLTRPLPTQPKPIPPPFTPTRPLPPSNIPKPTPDHPRDGSWNREYPAGGNWNRNYPAGGNWNRDYPSGWNRDYPGGWNRDYPPRGGDHPWRITTFVGGPTFINVEPRPTVWLPPRTVYNNFPPVVVNWPPINLPPIIVDLPGLAVPRFGCSYVPTTFWSEFQTEVSYTSTITQPPLDALITVYVDPDTQQSSTDWGSDFETVYEVYIYTTTAGVDVISSVTSCLW